MVIIGIGIQSLSFRIVSKRVRAPRVHCWLSPGPVGLHLLLVSSSCSLKLVCVIIVGDKFLFCNTDFVVLNRFLCFRALNCSVFLQAPF